MGTTTNDHNAAVATVLRTERAAQMITLRDLSEKSGIPTTTLMRIEKGERDIRISDLYAIAGALGIEAEDVLRRAR